MKRLLLAIIFSIPLVTFGQKSPFGLINTEAGSQLCLEARKDNGGSYCLSITHYYKTIFGEGSFLVVEIPSDQIINFKSQLRQVRDKYDEWYKIAKANNVESVEKGIPVEITAFGDIYGEVSSPEEKSMKAVFFVANYNIHCIIKLFISGYNTNQFSEWVLTSSDMDKILTEIDNTIQLQREYDNKRNQTLDLFK